MIVDKNIIMNNMNSPPRMPPSKLSLFIMINKNDDNNELISTPPTLSFEESYNDREYNSSKANANWQVKKE